MPDLSWLANGFDHIWLPYAQMKDMALPLPVVGAEGAKLFLADGRVLVDGIASWWTSCHGYNHPVIVRALHDQLDRLSHVMLGGLANEPAYQLADRLAQVTPGDLSRVFFSESGSVSVEIAMKIAHQYWINNGHKDKHRFLSFHHSYHGDTMAAMSVCDPDDGMHKVFSSYLPKQIFCKLPRLEEEKTHFLKVLAQHRHELAAIMIEPLVQGAGGMKFHDKEVLRFVADMAKEHDVLLIADEIMTGFGRLGPMFACEAANIVPDIMTLSKALTGGTLPLAATMARTVIFDAFLGDSADRILMHGPTYSGNALACRAALASLDLFATEPRLAQVQAIEAQMKDGLRALARLKGVIDVRIKGALGVVQLSSAEDVSWLRAEFLKEDVWVRPFGDIVYLAPSFVISREELDRLMEAIHRVLHRWAAHHG